MYIFGPSVIRLSIEGESFELSVVVIDPLTSEPILRLDVLTHLLLTCDVSN